MAQLNTGLLGATRQSWERDNPRSLLKQIMTDNLKADENIVFSEFFAALEDENNRGFWKTMALYWFTNNYRSLCDDMQIATVRRSRAKRKAARRQQAVTSAAETIRRNATRLVLLDWTLPNGKKLRYCKGREIVKLGGWLAQVAKQVGPDELVGTKLSEADVQKIFAKAA